MPSFLSFILTFFCFICSIFISQVKSNGFSVELIQRYSYKSPFYNPTQTKPQQIFNAVQRSANRANYMNRKFSSTLNKKELSLILDSDSEYLLSYSIGTPPFKVYGDLDTGSNIIWHQCMPCNICYNQTSPIFNPSKSSSYQNISCSSRRCKSLEETTCFNDQDTCEYTVDYGHGTKTQGFLSMETLTLISTSDSIVSFPKFMIGCGHTNTLNYEYKGPSSGVIGLGTGHMSLIKQLGSLFEEKFSYCLVDEYNSMSNISSKLNFGDAAIVTGDNVVSTPMDHQKDYYYLNLKAFSVGNKRIKYKGVKREGTNASTHNIIIDSGTPVTVLPRNFYRRLESAVKKVVKLERFYTDAFNLCYNTTSQPPNFPEITAHFSGANVKLDYNGAFTSLFEGVKCLSFRPSPRVNGLGLFGNIAQVNYLVGYDLTKKIVSFKPTDCSKY
ncbi:aspartic proteinase CDR1-like [Vicia villosa]|uniref:aspartic proteinase CDR1-like n=1 Tax=Vicia villosa TaxID=3911 RepID=UPI00273CE14F|nr:aspartic proteinase CDR1-like [Vicia villosa]XP_058777094.1 aspartic proteinase CDR1-like [Vicia villosa]